MYQDHIVLLNDNSTYLPLNGTHIVATPGPNEPDFEPFMVYDLGALLADPSVRLVLHKYRVSHEGIVDDGLAEELEETRG